jgi:prevent-host-death family protein
VKLGQGKKPIQEVAISEFKAKCLALLEEVDKTKVSLRVTKRGKPIAEVIPTSPKHGGAKLAGFDVRQHGN